MDPKEISDAVGDVLRKSLKVPVYDGGVEADYLVYSECGHEPIKCWRANGVRGIQLGDYGVCWCDDDRERRVVRIGFKAKVGYTDDIFALGGERLPAGMVGVERPAPLPMFATEIDGSVSVEHPDPRPATYEISPALLDDFVSQANAKRGAFAALIAVDVQLAKLERWDMLTTDDEGRGIATADAPWARACIETARSSIARVLNG